jgi:hypothetical protein
VFSERAVRILPQAAEVLRGLSDIPQEQGELRGRIEALRRRGNRGPGRIEVKGHFNEEPLRSVLVELDESAYDQAVLAHRSGLPIFVRGVLRREGRSWLLGRARDFRVGDAASNG